MANETFTRKCWCDKCEDFSEIEFRQSGERKDQFRSHIIFHWECPVCQEEDVDEITEIDWKLLVEGKCTHYNLIRHG